VGEDGEENKRASLSCFFSSFNTVMCCLRSKGKLSIHFQIVKVKSQSEEK
jgi:hypothetical protein